MIDLSQTLAADENAALIVEDERIVAFDIEQILFDIGFQHIRTVATLASAREALCDVQKVFSLVILDIKLQDGNGLSLLGECKKLKIPVLIVTGYSTFEHATVQVIHKPFSSADLAERIRLVLGDKVGS